MRSNDCPATGRLDQKTWYMGVLGAIGLMILHSFIPFPAEFIAIANGAIYGKVLGILITWTGAMLGAWLAFGLARTLGRPFVHRMLTIKKAKFIDDWVETHGGRTLLICRLIPVIAFNLINYAAGLTRVSWWTFTWSTAIGILPLTILMVVMGDQMDKFPVQIWFVILFVGLTSWAIVHYLFHHRAENG